jgi:hypothetical protein
MSKLNPLAVAATPAFHKEYLSLMSTQSTSEVLLHLDRLETAYENHLAATGSIDGAEEVRELIDTLRLLLQDRNTDAVSGFAVECDPRVIDCDLNADDIAALRKEFGADADDFIRCVNGNDTIN